MTETRGRGSIFNMAAVGAVRKRAPAVILRQIDLNLDSDDDLFLPPGTDPPPRDAVPPGVENTDRADRRGSLQSDTSIPTSTATATHGPSRRPDTDPPPSSPGVFPMHTPYQHWGANGDGYRGGGPGGFGGPGGAYGGSTSSIVEGLLLEIYDRWQYPQRDSLDSDTFTECSSTSEAFWGRGDSVDFVGQRNVNRLNKVFLEGKGECC
jgi:hypothetical protein